MLRTSAKVAGDGAGRRPRRSRLDHLYRGQSNDCYWHGLFGGIYISHMRLATYEHLIAAEDLADSARGQLHEAERRDLDMDGQDDVRLAGPGQVVTIDLGRRAPGSAAGTSGRSVTRWRRSCAAGPRPTTRRSVCTRPGWPTPAAAPGDPTGRRPRSTTS